MGTMRFRALTVVVLALAFAGCGAPMKTRVRAGDSDPGKDGGGGDLSSAKADGAAGTTPQGKGDAGGPDAITDTGRGGPAGDGPVVAPGRDAAVADAPLLDAASFPDGFVPPAEWGWGDAGPAEYPELCASHPDLATGSCQCLPNQDFSTGPQNGGCAARIAGQACTRDCCGTCGLVSSQGPMGVLRRPCANGTYAAETCTPPADWRRPLVGGGCSPPMEMGTTATYTSAAAQGLPCNTEWGVCFTLGDSAPGRERGCACLFDATVGGLRMACGQVHGWFSNNGQDWSFMSGLVWRSGDFDK